MAYKCNKPALKMLGKNHLTKGPLSMGSPLNNSKFNTTQYQNVIGGGTKKWIESSDGDRQKLRQGIATNLDAGLTLSGVGSVFRGIKGLFSAARATFPLIKEGVKTYAQSQVKNTFDNLNSSNVEDNSVPNVTSEAFGPQKKSNTITDQNAMWEDNVLSMRSPLSKTAPGKKFSVKDGNRTVSYGEKGYTIGKCGSEKAHNYCARSSGIKECADPPCANALSRKKWKCVGKRSVC